MFLENRINFVGMMQRFGGSFSLFNAKDKPNVVVIAAFKQTLYISNMSKRIIKMQCRCNQNADEAISLRR